MAPVAVVTGATSGIGTEITRGLANAGTVPHLLQKAFSNSYIEAH